jgi:hypothetical protein
MTQIPSIDEWRSKMWYIHTVKYYLAIKGHKGSTHATMWMNFKNMLNKGGQTYKAHIVRFHLYEIFKMGKSN